MNCSMRFLLRTPIMSVNEIAGKAMKWGWLGLDCNDI
jgi:hypothetical protein